MPAAYIPDTPEQIAHALEALEGVGIVARSLAAGAKLACARLAQADPPAPARVTEGESDRLRDAETGGVAWRARYIEARKRCSAIETERDELLVTLEILKARLAIERGGV